MEQDSGVLQGGHDETVSGLQEEFWPVPGGCTVHSPGVNGERRPRGDS